MKSGLGANMYTPAPLVLPDALMTIIKSAPTRSAREQSGLNIDPTGWVKQKQPPPFLYLLFLLLSVAVDDTC
jgi:hypothetical protein